MEASYLEGRGGCRPVTDGLGLAGVDRDSCCGHYKPEEGDSRPEECAFCDIGEEFFGLQLGADGVEVPLVFGGGPIVD